MKSHHYWLYMSIFYLFYAGFLFNLVWQIFYSADNPLMLAFWVFITIFFFSIITVTRNMVNFVDKFTRDGEEKDGVQRKFIRDL